MKATKRTQYALRAMIYLAKEEGVVSSVRVIATQEDISPDYLEKIFTRLEKAGLVVSYKGASGGYLLSRSASKITLKDIFTATEEPLAVVSCISHKCPRDKKCTATRAWREVNKKIESVFCDIKLSNLIT